MPKKTKKQKLLAEKHRQAMLFGLNNSPLKTLNSTPVKSQIIISRNSSTTHSTQQYSFISHSVPVIKSSPSNNEYGYVMMDLKRISLLTFLAISLQVVIYFVLKGS